MIPIFNVLCVILFVGREVGPVGGCPLQTCFVHGSRENTTRVKQHFARLVHPALPPGSAAPAPSLFRGAGKDLTSGASSFPSGLPGARRQRHGRGELGWWGTALWGNTLPY